MHINTLPRHRSARFARTSAEGGGGAPTTVAEPTTTATAVTFKPPASQDELDKIIQDRVRREQAKYRDYDSLKAKAEQFDILARESQTDRERELEEARLEAYHEAMSQIVPQAVTMAFKAEAKGVMSDEALSSLLEDLDLTKYATDEGQPDGEKIARKIAALAPPAKDESATRKRSTVFGQGPRPSTTVKRGEAGLAEAQRRFGGPAETKS